MKFALNSDQLALRDAARDALQRLCPPAAVRSAWGAPPDRRAWQALDEMGALELLVPTSCGGLGLDETYLVPVIREAGRVALPHPLTVTAMVAAALDPVALPSMRPAPVAATDLGIVWPARSGAAAVPGAMPERTPPVAAAAIADVMVLAVGDELRAFTRSEVEIEPVVTVDRSRHSARVRPSAPGRLLSDDPGEIEAAFDRGVLGTAAELVGLSQTMLDMTVSYVSQRRQFGKPVGSFQAVKHHLADARVQHEFAMPAVDYAAYAVAHRLSDASRAVSLAKWQASSAASITARAALQCHGAIGYTVESDLHLYIKRSWALIRSWGDADFHAGRVAAAIGL